MLIHEPFVLEEAESVIQFLTHGDAIEHGVEHDTGFAEHDPAHDCRTGTRTGNHPAVSITIPDRFEHGSRLPVSAHERISYSPLSSPDEENSIRVHPGINYRGYFNLDFRGRPQIETEFQQILNED